MTFFKCTLALALVAFASATVKSSCPEVFNGDTVKKSEGKWEGVLNLDSEFGLSGLWVRIQFDKKVQNVAHESAEVVTEDHKSWLFRMPNASIEAGQKVNVPFTVKYDEKEGVPSLTHIRLNAREICPEKKEAVVISPCPAIMKFVNIDKKEEGRWYGELHLDSEFTLNGVWIRLFLDKQGKILPNGFGEVEPRDHNSFLIRNKQHLLKPGTTLKVPFIVAYEGKDVPNIDKVRLNARTVCVNNLVPKGTTVAKVEPAPTTKAIDIKKEEKPQTEPAKVEEKKDEKKEEKPVEKKEEKKEEKKDEKVVDKKEEKVEEKHEHTDNKQEVPPRAHLDNPHHHPHSHH